MRAIIIATGYHMENRIPSLLDERYPPSMLPLLDRPFIQHIVEFLVNQGINNFEFILSHLPEKVEKLIGDGVRWGSEVKFHLAREASKPYRSLKIITADEKDDEIILLGHADRLPLIDYFKNPTIKEANENVIFCSNRGKWTGWGWFTNAFIKNLKNGLDEAEARKFMLSRPNAQKYEIESSDILSVESYNDLIYSHKSVLTQKKQALMSDAQEIESGVFLSRNVVLHPTVQIIPPVYIGENSRVNFGAKLGPNATIGKNCVLDENCRLSNSVIFPGSYIGENLEALDSVVDKNCLVNTKIGASVSLTDDFILGKLSDKNFRKWLSKIFSRIAAAGLLTALSPILLIIIFLRLFKKGPIFHKKNCVKLPAASEEYKWREFKLLSFDSKNTSSNVFSMFFLRLLPALINIAKGELRFVGVSPRTKKEILELSNDWKNLYLKTKSGVITEADVFYGNNPNEDELYSAEAFYSVNSGLRRDLKLITKYFLRSVNIFSLKKNNLN